MSTDIIDGSIGDSTSLNLYAFVNGNPISFIDPFGLSAERGQGFEIGFDFHPNASDYLGWGDDLREIGVRSYNYAKYGFNVSKVGKYAIINGAHSNAALSQGIKGTRYAFINAEKYPNVFGYVKPSIAVKNALSLTDATGGINWGGAFNYATVAVDVGIGIYDNIQAGTSTQRIVSDAVVDAGFGIGGIAGSTAAGAAAGSLVPGIGNIVGAGVGLIVGGVIYVVTDVMTINDRSVKEWTKYGVGEAADWVVNIWD